MWLRRNKGAALAIAVGVAVIAVHVFAATGAALMASRWANWIVIGLAAVVVIAVHLVGFYRLAARRGPDLDARRRVE